MKQSNTKQQLVRMVALVLALLMGISVLVSALSLLVSAADDDQEVKIKTIEGAPTNVPTGIKKGGKYTIKFNFVAPLSGAKEGDEISGNPEVANGWWDDSDAIIDLKVTGTSGNEFKFAATIKNLKYDSSSKYTNLTISKITNDVGINLFPNIRISMDLDEGKFSGNLSTSGKEENDDDDAPPTSNIQVENVVALDSAGNKIDQITKDSPPFALEIVYADIGLQKVDADDIKSGDMQVYMNAATGFNLPKSSKGVVKVASTSGDYPRFRAHFENVTYNGGGNSVGFEVYYILNNVDAPVKGTGTGILYAAKSDDASSDDKMGIAVPKIIISAYSYGEESIVAGNEFNLDFTVKNTSSDAPLENIVITLTPTSNEAATKGPGLIVASSSNTIYVPKLDTGASQSYSVSFQARPDAEVTSHLISVRFSYEYVDPKLKTREKVPDQSESVAIPVAQVDRFQVYPIVDTPYAMVGEEMYCTVNFVNLGKSTTYNIAGSMNIDESITVQGQHFGNLEPGQANTLDLYFTGSMPGQFEGNVVITYEDDNNSIKEITTPVVINIEEPWYPQIDQPDPFPDDMEQPEQGPGLLTVIMCVFGGIAIAVPIALYLIKRVNAKGSEEFDEDY